MRTFRVASYRFRTTFRDRFGGYLAVVILVGLLGGVAMGAVAGARRTQSSFPEYLASTNPSDLEVGTGIFNPNIGSSAPYNADLVAEIAHLPHVKAVATFTGFNPEIVALKAFHVRGHLPAGEQPAGLLASTDGQFTTQDRALVEHGRPADPRRIDEVVVTPGEARVVGIHVGSVVRIGIFTNAQVLMPECCSADGAIKPYRRINLKVVGIVAAVAHRGDERVPDARSARPPGRGVGNQPIWRRRSISVGTVGTVGAGNWWMATMLRSTAARSTPGANRPTK